MPKAPSEPPPAHLLAEQDQSGTGSADLVCLGHALIIASVNSLAGQVQLITQLLMTLVQGFGLGPEMYSPPPGTSSAASSSGPAVRPLTPPTPPPGVSQRQQQQGSSASTSAAFTFSADRQPRPGFSFTEEGMPRPPTFCSACGSQLAWRLP